MDSAGIIFLHLLPNEFDIINQFLLQQVFDKFYFRKQN